jgi:hypothetical protein
MMGARPHGFRRRFLALLLGLTGALPAGSNRLPAQDATPEPVVVLPPLTVSDRGAPLKWRYLEMPGLEILSVCEDSTSEAFAQRLRRLDDLLRVILPARFTTRMSVPETMILLDDRTGQARSREVLADLTQKNGARIRFMPNLRVVDLDATAVFAVVQPSTPATFTYATDRIAFLLERRVPRPPDWFIEGILGFYQQLEFRERDIEVRRALWLSPGETMALATDADRPRTLLPMGEFFARRRSKAETPGELDRVWRAQAALFVRWATVENNGANKEALWRFADRLETAAPSEALFREHFGLGYSDARDQLSDYLGTAAQERTLLPVPPTPRQRLRFRAATDLEIARIRGEWERMEIAYVHARSPAYVDKYVEQARRTLGRAYERGERDPRLLATLGLTEIDAGNPANARLFLEAATQGNVVRPRAYYELARLRYEAFLGDTGPEKKLSAGQAADIMVPLLALRRQEPPLAQTYALMTNVLSRSVTPPTAEQLAMLHEGAKKFPQISELMVRVIYFHVHGGQPNAADALIELALNHAPDAEMRAKLEQVRDELAQMKK